MTAAQPQPSGRATPHGPPPVDTWFDEAVPRLYGYFLVRVGGNVAIAEDLTQETVIGATHARQGPAEGVPVMAWLFGIARNKLMDHFRSMERTRRHLGNRVQREAMAFSAAPSLGELDLDAVDVRDAVVSTLDALPPNQRAALILRYLDGWSVEATARELNLSLHAAESLLTRARRSFRQFYARQEGPHHGNS